MNKNAGRMDRQITFQEMTSTPDGYGGQVETWTDSLTVWAELLPLSQRGREYFAASQVNAEKFITFRTRYVAGLGTMTRFTYDGTVYDIQHISEVGRKDRLDITGKRP